MVIHRKVGPVGSHLVYDGLEASEQRVDGLSIKLDKVLVLSLVGFIVVVLDLLSSLVVVLQPHPNLTSGLAIRNTLKLGILQTREENTTGPAIGIVLVNLLLPNSCSQELAVGIFHDLPNTPVNTHEMRLHLDLPERVIDAIELRWFAKVAKPMIHVAFMRITDRLRWM